MARVLWIDDEIELLKPHIIFLKEKGNDVDIAYNGEDAVEMVRKNEYDIVFLDEMMPGMDGLTTLEKIKSIQPYLKVVMVTKSEEESLMEEAIGAQIDDYLTKPVNPSQILLAMKKLLESTQLSQQRMTMDVLQDIRNITEALGNVQSIDDWYRIFDSLVRNELVLDKNPDSGIKESLLDLQKECNKEFSKYMENNYLHWIHSEHNRPLFSTDIVSNYVYPLLDANEPTLFIIIDCLRYDQWMAMEELLAPYFEISKDFFISILPTATPFSRNALFSGLFPIDIQKKEPSIYARDLEDESGANRFEWQLLDFNLRKLGYKPKKDIKYSKVFSNDEIKPLLHNVDTYSRADISALVINSVDIIAHNRSDSPVMKEIAPNEQAYRQLTKTWFEHSPLYDLFKLIARTKTKIVLTSDHGSIRVMRGAKVLADRESSVNLRYKFGRNLKVNEKQAVIIKSPVDYKLPDYGPSTQFIIAKEDNFFVYPTNYNHYLNHYRDSFQHGGISMEEMILPVITMKGKE
ncbi:MAG: response regulator [Calditrichia bacterium]